jgi:hypothetical protein
MTRPAPPDPRERLEAAIRRALAAAALAIIGDAPATAPLNRAVEEILAAADAYAAGDSGQVTALRRGVLASARTPPLHWLDGAGGPACQPAGAGGACTGDSAAVTCRPCRCTAAYRAALAVAP